MFNIIQILYSTSPSPPPGYIAIERTVQNTVALTHYTIFPDSKTRKSPGNGGTPSSDQSLP